MLEFLEAAWWQGVVGIATILLLVFAAMRGNPFPGVIIEAGKPLPQAGFQTCQS